MRRETGCIQWHSGVELRRTAGGPAVLAIQTAIYLCARECRAGSFPPKNRKKEERKKDTYLCACLGCVEHKATSKSKCYFLVLHANVKIVGKCHWSNIMAEVLFWLVCLLRGSGLHFRSSTLSCCEEMNED